MTRIRLGMLTPSSNTVLEPTTAAIVHPLDGVTAHFSRLQVREISLSSAGLAQFELAPFLEAAALLADAKMHVIAWNGTSAAWRGFHEDEQLCAQMADRFGVAATASMLALNAIMRARGITRFGLVTPYTDDVQTRIVENYAGAGFDCVAERHTGIRVNFDFSAIPAEHIIEQTRAVAAGGPDARPDAILIVCTNLPSAHLVAALERELGIPIYDSTSAVVWHALRLAGVDPSRLHGWGRLFSEPDHVPGLSPAFA